MTDTTITETDTSKSILASKTIWGIIVAALPQLLGLFHISVLPGFSEAINSLADQVITLSGCVIATYGRLKAVKTLITIRK